MRLAFASVLSAILALHSASIVQAGAGAPPDPILGTWLTESGNLEVDIRPCGSALCGTVVKVLANRSMSRSGADMAPDPGAILGKKILIDFVQSGDGQWSGEIYNRENLKTYSCKLSLTSPDELAVRPYIGVPLFGKTQIWRRV